MELFHLCLYRVYRYFPTLLVSGYSSGMISLSIRLDLLPSATPRHRLIACYLSFGWFPPHSP